MTSQQHHETGRAVDAVAVPRATIRLLGRLNQRGFRLVMLADVVGLLTVLVGSMVWRFGWEWPDAPMVNYMVSFVLALIVFLAAFYFGGLYERDPRLGAPPALPRAAQHSLGAGGLVALLSLGLSGVARELGIGPSRALPFPFINLAILIVGGAMVVAMNRYIAQRLRTRREGHPRVLLIGSESDLATATATLQDEAAPVEVVDSHEAAEDLMDRVRTSGATDVMLLSSELLDGLNVSVLRDLDRAGIAVLLRVGSRETMFGLERLREIGGMPFVLLRTRTMPRSRLRFKRLFDLTLLFVGAPLILPLVLLVGLYQLVVAGRPILYWQERVGAGGQTFRLVKFRTMARDAESDGQGARLAERDDPRIIGACQWIRSTRMDELPQLWNVLRGEMSLVGPRPERPELTAEFERRIPGYERRHEVPPGLTGLAQIHGRYHTDPEYKLGYDLQYLVNWSPILDLEILVRTTKVIAWRSG